MKQNIIFLFFLPLLTLFVFSASAQITKEHVYGPNVMMYPWKLSDGRLLYTVLDKPSAQLKIYNSNHSLFKTISVPQVANYSISAVHYVSDKLFNQSAELEYLVYYGNTASNDLTTSSMVKVFSETGTELFSITGAMLQQFIHTPSGTKMVFIKYITPQTADSQYEIYSLPGHYTTLLSASPELEESQALNPYPNPTTSSIINLTYQLTPGEQGELVVFDTKGTILSSFTIDSTFSSLILDVSKYTKGIYIYTVRQNGKPDKSAKFLVQ